MKMMVFGGGQGWWCTSILKQNIMSYMSGHVYVHQGDRYLRRVWIAQIMELFVLGDGMNEEVDEWVWVLMTPKGRGLSRRWYRICACGSRISTIDKLKHNNILCDDQLQIGLVRDGWFSKKISPARIEMLMRVST
jgi:hypothetical protein